MYNKRSDFAVKRFGFAGYLKLYQASEFFRETKRLINYHISEILSIPIALFKVSRLVSSSRLGQINYLPLLWYICFLKVDANILILALRDVSIVNSKPMPGGIIKQFFNQKIQPKSNIDYLLLKLFPSHSKLNSIRLPSCNTTQLRLFANLSESCKIESSRLVYSPHNQIKRNRGSELAGLLVYRSLDIYPYKIPIYSMSGVVDHLYIVIDSDIPPLARKDSTPRSYEIAKLKDFALSLGLKCTFIDHLDFGYRYSKFSYPKASWIADAVNLGISYIKEPNILFLMGDEGIHPTMNKEIVSFCNQKYYTSLSPIFYHFIYNIHTVRSRSSSAYLKAIRLFKTEHYRCCWDGFDFKPVSNRYTRDLPSRSHIYHYGYVFDHQTKVDYVTGPHGIFESAASAYKDVETEPFKGIHPPFLSQYFS